MDNKSLHDLELDREGSWIKLGKERYDKSEKKKPRERS